MIRLIFIFLFSPFILKAQVVTPYESLSPLLVNTKVDEFFSYQWGLVNYGQTVFEQLGPLENRPTCGKSFEVPSFDLGNISTEDFFLETPGRSCKIKNSTQVVDDDDVSWLPLFLDLEKMVKRDVVVAILDFGLDYRHPDIQDNIAKDFNRCNDLGLPKLERPKKKRDRSERRKGLPNISEFDFSNDCLGWNFTDLRSRLGNSRPKDTDQFSHGTHLAGIISAVSGNGIGVQGVSNRIKILPVKVLENIKKETIKKFGQETIISQILNQISLGLDYVAQVKRYGRPVDAVNLSFGLPTRLATPRVKASLQKVLDQGITVIAAAGNEDVNVDIFPCSFPGVICVGAHSNGGQLAGFSNYGSSVDITAPGELILSLNKTTELSSLFVQSDLYDFQTGTSQSAPFVAAAAALLKGAYPKISSQEVKARLYSSAAPMSFKDHRFTLSGRLQMSSALTSSARPYLRPQLKKLTQLKVKSKKINITFPLKNLWASAKNVNVSVRTLNSNVIVSTKAQKINQLKAFSSKELNFQANIIDFNGASRVKLAIDLNYLSETGHKYSDSFILETELFIHLDDAEALTFPIDFKSETLANINELLDENPDQLNLGRTLTKKITPSDITNEDTEYFVDHVTLKDGVPGIEISILSQNGQRFQQKPLVFLPKTKSFRVTQLDIIPGNIGDEYVLRSVGYENIELKEKSSGDNSDEFNYIGQFIEYYVFDQNYNLLHSSLKLKPLEDLPGRNLDLGTEKNFRFEVAVGAEEDNLQAALSLSPKILRSEKNNFNKIFFISPGQLSDEDNDFDIASFEGNEFFGQQLYYLNKIDGKSEMKLRTFSSPSVRKNIQQMFVQQLYERGEINSPRIHPNMVMELWHIFQQNDLNDEIRVLGSFSMQGALSVGVTDLKSWPASLNTNHFFTLSIKENKNGQGFNYHVEPFDELRDMGLSFDITRDKFMTYFALNKLLKGDYLSVKDKSFSRAQLSYKGLLSKKFSSKSRSVEVKKLSESEVLLNDLISYKNGEKLYSLFKTLGEILLTTSDGQDVSFSTSEVKVSDFISFFTFQELVAPSLYRENGQSLPALYVNASEIYSRRVYSWVVRQGTNDLVAPINLNIEVSDGCLPLSPSKLKGSLSMNYTFLCKTPDNKFALKFIPIQKIN